MDSLAGILSSDGGIAPPRRPLKVKKTHPDAIIPQYATAGAACFDLHTINGGYIGPMGGTANFNTGLSFEIPEGFVMLVYSRSGHGFKNGLRAVNSVGVIDSDYRGTVAVKMINDSLDPFDFNAGDRVAQAMIVRVDQWDLVEVDELSSTERGVGGFGSTGQGAL